MKKKVFIFTVGTSLVSGTLRFNKSNNPDNKDVYDFYKPPQDYKKALTPDFDRENYSFKPCIKEMITKTVSFLRTGGDVLDPIKNIEKREIYVKNPDDINKDKLSAEMSTIYLYYYKKGFLDKTDLDEESYFYFLGTDTPDGCFCATVLSEYFKKPLYINNVRFSDKYQIEDLDSNDSDSFINKGIFNLFKVIYEKIIIKNQDADQIYLVISGGFKNVPIFVNIFGGIFPRTKLLYVYEYTPHLIEMDVLPIGFDILSWRDYRSILNTLDLFGSETVSEPFKTSEIKSLIEALPSNIKALVYKSDEKEKKFTTGLNPFGKFLKNRYKEILENKRLSQHGEGTQLLELVDNQTHKDYLRERIKIWQHLWIGDKIPEMAEHQRGHTQRLQELAYPVLKALNEAKKITDYDIITMILAIWLHDIGNSGDSFTLYPEFFEDDKERETFYIKGFPTLVREFHNFMSYTLMDPEGDMGKFLYGEKEIPVECIYGARIIGAYHRKAMPFPGGEKNYNVLGKDDLKITFTPGETFNMAIKNNSRNEETANQIDVNLLTALFRIIDASDTQLERAVDKEYVDTRKELIQLEKAALKNKILLMDKSYNSKRDIPFLTKETLFDIVFREHLGQTDEKGELYRYTDRYNFIGKQPGHYEKHKLLSTVLILKSNKTDDKTIFNHISIFLKENSVTIDQIEELIKEDFIKEYTGTKTFLEEKGIYFKFHWYSKSDKKSEEVKL